MLPLRDDQRPARAPIVTLVVISACVAVFVRAGSVGLEELSSTYGLVPADAIDESTISQALYTSGLPDPDLVIRTGGEHRLSNFLIWQSAYAELITSDTLWPDFGPADLDLALAEYASRTRRFGR